ncbi:MAG: hypothetical protein IBX69_19770 [Anaerolineales bacterium]|nr:hypothetical protein [Anaerolineales bacterium]
MNRRFLIGIIVISVLLAGCARSQPETEVPNGEPYPVAQPTTPAEPEDPTQAPAYPGPGGIYEGPFLPQPGDEELERGEIFIETFTLLTMESFPPQFALVIRGNLPTPCHELRAIVDEPDTQNRIMIETYSVVDPEEACVLVLQPFEVSIPLGSFPDGEYSIYVNDGLVAEFTSP